MVEQKVRKLKKVKKKNVCDDPYDANGFHQMILNKAKSDGLDPDRMMVALCDDIARNHPAMVRQIIICATSLREKKTDGNPPAVRQVPPMGE